jgi:hypothetical protein
MTALSPLLIPALLGYFALAAFLRSVPIRHKGLFLTALSLPAGLGLCSTILFVSLWIMPSQAKLISLSASVVTALTLGGFLLLERLRARQPHAALHSPLDPKTLFKKFLSYAPKSKETILKFAVQSISALIFIATLWAIIHFFTLSVSTNMPGGWDARYMWSLKAKFMFRLPSEWHAMFSPQLSWSHTDYPLLWPGILAWGWNCLGHESLFWPPWASLCFYISCSLMVVWYLAAHVSSITGWLAGTFFFLLTPPLFWSIHQYTDVPLAFFITASGLILVTALRSGQLRLFAISGLMAGFAAWTKNEGGLFLLWAGILLAALKLLKKREPTVTFSFLKAFLGGALLPLLCILAFRIFLGKSGDYFGAERSIMDYLALVFKGGRNLAEILLAYWSHMSGFAAWKGLSIFFFLGGFVLFLKKRRNGYEGLLLALILSINLGYALAFLVTPNDLPWHLQNALQRLLVHTSPLAIAFSFEMLTFRKKIA